MIGVRFNRNMGLEEVELELQKAARKLHGFVTPKKFRKPDEKDRLYRKPAKVFRTNGVVDCCGICKRPTAFGSRRCRECFQKHVRDKYAAKVAAEAERVRIAKQALNSLERKDHENQETPRHPHHA